MYEAKSGVKKFSLYWGGGGVPQQKFFFQSEHVSSQIWCQKIFPLLRGVPRQKFFSSLNMYQAKSGVKNFSLYWDWVPPPQDLRLGPPPESETRTPPDLRPGPGTPPGSETGTWDPPLPGPGTPPRKCGQTENITFRHPSDAGGNNRALWLQWKTIVFLRCQVSKCNKEK